MIITNQQCMSIVLFENSANSGDVFNGKLEHDESHGCFTDDIVLIQVADRDTRQTVVTQHAENRHILL